MWSTRSIRLACPLSVGARGRSRPPTFPISVTWPVWAVRGAENAVLISSVVVCCGSVSSELVGTIAQNPAVSVDPHVHAGNAR